MLSDISRYNLERFECPPHKNLILHGGRTNRIHFLTSYSSELSHLSWMTSSDTLVINSASNLKVLINPCCSASISGERGQYCPLAFRNYFQVDSWSTRPDRLQHQRNSLSDRGALQGMDGNAQCVYAQHWWTEGHLTQSCCIHFFTFHFVEHFLSILQTQLFSSNKLGKIHKNKIDSLQDALG